MYKTPLLFGMRAFCISALVVVFAIRVSAQSEKIIYTFTGGSDGGSPYAGLVSDGKGNLYGTTESGGTPGTGTVFELLPGPNGKWTEQVLHNFQPYGGDGYSPMAGLVFDSTGNLYGTTPIGGNSTYGGTVFQLSPGPNGTWTEKILYSFSGGSDGAFPSSGVVLDAAGNIYGTTNAGGAFGFGTVFELVAEGGTWTEKVLHSFTGGNDGAYPYAITPVLDGEGNLYADTSQGGPHDYGLVFELIHNTWEERILHAFTGGADAIPASSLVLDGDGNLYGVSNYSAFELIRGPKGTWTEQQLYSFAGGKDGADPASPLIFDKAGNLYGTTYLGGRHRGTVFEMQPGTGTTWTERVLHSFSPDGEDGIFPSPAPLLLDSNGNLYGTTPGGGTSGSGVVFKVTP